MLVDIKISTSNAAAFQPAPQIEVARILRSLADKVEHAAMLRDCQNMPLRDREGDTAGMMTLSATEGQTREAKRCNLVDVRR